MDQNTTNKVYEKSSPAHFRRDPITRIYQDQ
jgi:hypothetical protein